jgi:hypothetical protein
MIEIAHAIVIAAIVVAPAGNPLAASQQRDST